MLTEVRQSPTAVRFGGLMPSDPTVGGTVDFVWYAGELPAECDLIGYLFSYEVLSKPIDLGNYISGVRTHDYHGEWNYYGNLITGKKALEPIYERFRNPHVPLRDLASLFASGYNSEIGHYIVPVQGENPCYHCQPVGYIDCGAATVNYRQPLEGYADVSQYALPTTITLVSTDPFVWTASASVSSDPIGSLAHALPLIKQEVEAGVWDRNGVISTRYHNFDFSVNDDGDIKVFFNFIVGYDDLASNTRTINTWAVMFESDQAFERPPVIDGKVNVGDICEMSISLTCAGDRGYWHTPVAGSSYPYDRTVDNFLDLYPYRYDANNIMTCPRLTQWDSPLVVRLNTPQYAGDIVPELLGWSRQEQRFISQSAGTFRHFERYSQNLISECMPLLHMAAVQAFDNHVQGLSSNYLETLSEYHSLFGVLDIGAFTKTVVKHYNRKLGSLLSILNILASGTLLYQFGIAPTVSDAKDVAKKASDLRARVLAGEIFKGATTYGSYKLPLPDDYPVLPGSLITARCKLRMNINDDVFLQRVIQGRSLGLLPTPSGLWDLIPGSFAIDWVYPVGDSLTMVENQFLMLALDIQYCVLSITIDTPIDVTALIDAGAWFSDDGGDGPHYRMYIRFVSRVLPQFGPTRLPVLESPTPKWSTVGSLAVVLGT